MALAATGFCPDAPTCLFAQRPNEPRVLGRYIRQRNRVSREGTEAAIMYSLSAALVLLVLLVVGVTILAVKVGTIALRLTGLDEHRASFQALSTAASAASSESARSISPYSSSSARRYPKSYVL